MDIATLRTLANDSFDDELRVLTRKHDEVTRRGVELVAARVEAERRGLGRVGHHPSDPRRECATRGAKAQEAVPNYGIGQSNQAIASLDRNLLRTVAQEALMKPQSPAVWIGLFVATGYCLACSGTEAESRASETGGSTTDGGSRTGGSGGDSAPVGGAGMGGAHPGGDGGVVAGAPPSGGADSGGTDGGGADSGGTDRGGTASGEADAGGASGSVGGQSVAGAGGVGGGDAGGPPSGGTAGATGGCVAPAGYELANAEDLDGAGFEAGRQVVVVAPVAHTMQCTALMCDTSNPCCNTCGWWNQIGIGLTLYSADPSIDAMCSGSGCDCAGDHCEGGAASCQWLEYGVTYRLWGELTEMDGWRDSLVVDGYCRVE